MEPQRGARAEPGSAGILPSRGLAGSCRKFAGKRRKGCRAGFMSHGLPFIIKAEPGRAYPFIMIKDAVEFLERS
jgi:hypothetical protein